MEGGHGNVSTYLWWPIVASVAVGILGWFTKVGWDKYQMAKVYGWLRANSSKEGGYRFRSTRAIASHNNMTEQRAHDLCSRCPQIYQSTGSNPDMWSIYSRAPKRASPRIRQL